MDMKDTLALAYWLRSKASYNDVMRTERIGLVGNVRFSETAVRAYLLLWTWSEARFSGSAGLKQERYYKRCGAVALQRRMLRARMWIDKLSK